MAIDRIESGFATLQYEIVEERASALGRMGRRLEAALAALSGWNSPDPKIRSGLLKEARHCFWLPEMTMSPLTRYLSRLLGVFLLVMAVSEWTRPGLLTVVAPAMVDQPALLWVSGMLTFATGLAIVLGHNAWRDPAAAVVSFLGWMMTIKGAALLLVPAAG